MQIRLVADRYIQSTLRPTKWVTLECTKNNSTGPHKPMNIIRDSLLAKITYFYRVIISNNENYSEHLLSK